MLVHTHERICTKDFRIPGTDITIPKDRVVHVYYEHIVKSEKNFVNPLNFDPDNFLPENAHNKFAVMGFGQGPRSCPGC